MTATLVRPKVRRVVLECRLCGTAYPTGFHPRCEFCGGPTDVFYDLSTARVGGLGEGPLRRYADLLPVADPDALVELGEEVTPLVHAVELGRMFGLSRLYLKVEGANPTRSTKDRMAAVALPFLRERGVTEFTVSSTGNSSTSFGWAAPRFPDLRMHIFCGAGFLDRLNFPPSPNVTVYSVDGSFVAAGKAAQEFAARTGLPFESGFFNPARREGLKLAYLEAVDQMPVEPSVVIQAISSGMGIYGAHKGFREYLVLGRLRRMPRIVCGQQASCAPMYAGWKKGVAVLDESFRIPHPDGLAKAILRGDASPTYPYMARVVRSSDGCFTATDGEEMRTARRLALELEGIEVCYASSVALASAWQLARRGWIDPEEPVLVNLTGSDRDPAPVPDAVRYEEPAGAAAEESP